MNQDRLSFTILPKNWNLSEKEKINIDNNSLNYNNYKYHVKFTVLVQHTEIRINNYSKNRTNE